MKKLLLSLATCMMLFSTSVMADVVLLVHGYLGDASSWEQSDVSQILDANGLKHSGRFVAGPHGPMLLVPKGVQLATTDDKVYLGDLPSVVPVSIQSDLLYNMLTQLHALHPDEDITLIGHSAGGVVARLALVRYRPAYVSRLITIASPHLGTYRAEQALDVTADNGPFNAVKSFFGGSGYDTLKHSRGVLVDLTRPHPGNMLYWLNAQVHPDIDYVSIVRLDPNGIAGDDLVPGYSQDMNNVAALHGRSRVIAASLPHTLTPVDAGLILDLLKR